MRLLLVLTLLISFPLFAQQQDPNAPSQQGQTQENAEQQESQEAEPAPPPGPSIREQNGVIIIGSTVAPAEEPEEEQEQAEQPAQQESQPADQEAAEGQTPEAEAGAAGDAPETAEAPQTQERFDPVLGIIEVPVTEATAAEEGVAEEGAAEGAAPQPRDTKRTSRRIKIYNASGHPVDVSITEQEVETPDESSTVRTLSTISDHEVPYLAERERIVSETSEAKTVERSTQRYDPNGNPTQQELVREEVRTLPDGTVVRTATTYVEDINGRMEPVERSVTRTKQEGDRTETVAVTERPSINGGFQPYTRRESVETRQGENSAIIEAVTKVNEGGSRMIEASREETVMSQSGNVSTTEKRVWERDKMSREMLYAGRTVGTLTAHPDGSSTENVETYGYSLGDGSPRFLDATQPQLLKTLTRETTIGANGEVVETTRTRTRDPAQPAEMPPAEMQQKVRRPGPDGETIETHVYEKTVSGGMKPTRVIVEQVQEN